MVVGGNIWKEIIFFVILVTKSFPFFESILGKNNAPIVFFGLLSFKNWGNFEKNWRKKESMGVPLFILNDFGFACVTNFMNKLSNTGYGVFSFSDGIPSYLF